MFRTSFILWLLAISTNLAGAECLNDFIGAKYNITKAGAQSKHSEISHMILWRKGSQVAHQYTDSQITEVWERIKNNQLRLVRHFDKYNRAIEYEPNEIKMQLGEEGWQKKKLLVTEKLISSMTLESTAGRGCQLLSIYSKENGKQSMHLKWLPNQKLVKHFTVKTPDSQMSWSLESVIETKEQVMQLFSSRSNYSMTDYTDIGDNESDPFLIKMINLGFVAHSSSGIYDQQGNSLEGAHRH